MLVPGKTGSEIAFVSLADPTLQEGMDVLAALVYGEWKFENGVYTLKRTTAAAIELEAAERDIAALKMKIKDVAESLRQPTWTQESAKAYAEAQYKMQQESLKRVQFQGGGSRPKFRIMGSSAEGPTQQLMSEVISGLDARILYGLPLGSRAVYSTRPNRMQQALRTSIAKPLQDFNRQNADIYDEVKRNPPPDLGADISGSLGFPSFRTADISKANVIVNRGFDKRFSVGIQLVGPSGEEIDQFSCQLVVQRNTSQPVIEPEKPRAQEPDVQIATSPIAKEFFGYLKEFGLFGGYKSVVTALIGDESEQSGINSKTVRFGDGPSVRNISPSPALLEILSDPSTTDPLTILLPELFTEIYGKSDYAALVPDLTWEYLAAYAGGPLMKSQVLQSIGYECETVEIDGKTIVRPVQPLRTENSRANRAAMRDFISATNAKGAARLSDIAKYASQRGKLCQGFECDMLILALATPFATSEMVRYFNQNFWFAPLLAGANQALDDISPGENYWALARMSAQQQSALERLIMDVPLEITMNSGSSSWGIIKREFALNKMASDTEPTERYPNGLPNNFALRLYAVEENGLFGRTKSAKNGKLLNLNDLGANLGAIDSATGSETDYRTTEFEEFKLAKVKTIALALADQQGTVIQPFSHLQFTDGEILAGSPMTLNQLPPEIIGQVTKVRDQIRQLINQMNSGKKPGQAPPP